MGVVKVSLGHDGQYGDGHVVEDTAGFGASVDSRHGAVASRWHPEIPSRRTRVMTHVQIVDPPQVHVDGQARVEAGSRPGGTGCLSALRHQSSIFRAEVPLHDLTDRGTGGYAAEVYGMLQGTTLLIKEGNRPDPSAPRTPPSAVSPASISPVRLRHACAAR